MKKILFTICALLFIWCGYVKSSDTESVTNKIEANYAFPSPEAASLGKFGIIPVDYSTGIPNISIPITEIVGKALKIPITLDYHSNGLKVSEMASWVGLDWGLNYGGIITRIVKGKDDFSVTDKLVHYDHWTEPFNLNYIDLKRIAKNYLDGEPDIFYFTIGNKSGKFILLNNEAIQLEQSSIKIKIDANKNFKITDVDGTCYFFNVKEYTDMEKGNYISAWNVSQITSPLKDTINFEYYNEEVIQNPETDILYGQSITFPEKNSSSSPPSDGISDTYLPRIGSMKIHKIKTSIMEIEFKTGSRTDIPEASKLDYILVSSINSNTVKKIDFFYGYLGPRLKLEAIETQNSNSQTNERYSFNYYNENNEFPKLTSYDQDHWGYYNGAGNTSFIPHLHEDQVAGNANKNPNYNFAKYGLIKKIVYPTGGFSEFYYSGNQYYYNGIKDGPGLKIDSIKNYDNTRKLDQKTYKYDINDVILDFDFDPQYLSTFSVGHATNEPDQENSSTDCHLGYWHYVAVYAQSSGNYALLSSSALKYDKVVEIYGTESNNIGEKEYYYFHNGLGISGHTELKKTVIKNSNNETVEVSENSINWQQGLTLYAHPYPRLQIKNPSDRCEIRVLSGGVCMIIYESYNYDPVYKYPLDEDYYRETYTIKQYHYSVDTTRITNYVNGESIAKTIMYNYNDQYLVKEKTTTYSNGDILKNIFKYPSDINTGVYKNMVDSNMLAYPIEETSSVDGNITQSKLITYKTDHKNYVQDKIYTLATTTPLSSFNEFDGNNKDDNYGYNPEIEFINYDSKGNITEIKKRAGMSISYLWSYNYQYPVAKIEGLTYDEVKTIIGESYISNLAVNPNPTKSDIEQIRSSIAASGKSAMVSTYTYAPLIGMATATDPRGVTTTYNYDSFNRLMNTQNDDGKLLNKYFYHYANQ